MEDLYKEAERLAGRPVEVVTTIDGTFIVEYFDMERRPPPKALSEDGALMAFINYMGEKQDNGTS
jgi:hypothetical protein